MTLKDARVLATATVTRQDATADTWDMPIVDGSVTIDASWTPCVQASLVVPLDEYVADRVDPTQAALYEPMVHVNLIRDLSQGSEQQPGLITMTLRRITTNYARQTMTLQCTSLERWPETYVWQSLTPYNPGSTDLETVVNGVLLEAGTGAGLSTESFPISHTIPADTEWTVGQSAMSYLRAIVEPSGRKLICDDRGRFLLARPDEKITPGPLDDRIIDHSEIIEMESSRAVDGGHYYDRTLLLYEWIDAAGATQRDLDVSTARSRTHPTWNVQRISGTRYPGAGGADEQQARLDTWSYERTVRTLWDLYVRPGIVVHVDDLRGGRTGGRVHRVTYHANGLMDFTQTYG